MKLKPRKKPVKIQKNTEIPVETTPQPTATPEVSATESSNAEFEITPIPNEPEVPVADTSTTESSPETSEATATVPPTDTSTMMEPSDNQSTTQSPDSVDGNESTTTTDNNITDQILEDLEKQAKDSVPVEVKKEYADPPDYEYRGRGLVYNCVGKHWACVDGPSYKKCENNFSSVIYLKKKVECHPFEIYETISGCENMQNRKISSSTQTVFCLSN